MTPCRLGSAPEPVAVVAASAVGLAGASRLWAVARAVVLVGVGLPVVDGRWRRVRGSVARSTTAAVASSSMEGKVASAQKVSAAGVLLVLSASVLGLAMVLALVPVPVLGFGVALVVTVVAGVLRRSRFLRPVDASVPWLLSLCEWRALRRRCLRRVAPLRPASMMTSEGLTSS